MSDDLFVAARDAMSRCHAPYSEFPVGAALRADDGNIYTGANVEVASYPEGWCAETTAIGHMIMAGGLEITEVAVIAEKMDACTPCGGCRQRLAEFAGPDTKIHLCDANGIVKTVTLGELLPYAFDADALK
ncbi:cytidine deaminase [Nitratireductor sp. XY-223]|uniref:cytidine deaminase n=1 Tax=Nitratireductor sp. XY-223 TaxID=2561926 RepID=UPI0010A9AA83|nr:cytidine deaminase [Nitratireductor sp. XY-223]